MGTNHNLKGARFMFGYVVPVKTELKVRELERFRAVYCGLCQEIKRRYGRYHTLFLSYDMTFLALLLGACTPEDSGTEPLRCGIRAFRTEQAACSSPALTVAADASVLLVRHKLLDTVQDETGVKRAGAWFLERLGSRAFTQAEEAFPALHEITEQCMRELSALEKERVPSLDRTADAFARITQAMIPPLGEDTTRILRHLFYHLGRWIYLIDAVQDLAEDMAVGEYNPVARRFDLKEPDIAPIRADLQLTLERSLLDIHGAFQLLKIYRDGGLLENIIDLGLPLVTKQVLDGTFHRNGGRNQHGSL